MTTVADILASYRVLRGYCDDAAGRVGERFGAAWQCREGCCGCCRLETVCGLEALVLLPLVSGQPAADANGGECCLLRDARCLAYPERPLICRTHGLPVVGRELTAGEIDCCPLNLPALSGLDGLPAELVLDLDLVTENLMRLNLALFLLLGRPELAASRFPLTALVGGGRDLPAELLAAGDSGSRSLP